MAPREPSRPPRRSLATIGYQGATPDGFRRALEKAEVELLVDIRAVASSRRPGFSKTKLAAGVEDVGIGYLHLRALGTPADGRAAARAGKHAEMRVIFLAHMATPDAQAALADLAEIVRGGQRVCLLCFEADPAHCHRNIVAAQLADVVPLEIVHLFPDADPLF
ncbi:MAG TPA: DUF488 domain-containing protein [Gemmatimonadaceae bacterium]|jgi:uncharacterized protein (DUF488 family)|nr:DUF488 domain-containing protein [Gemmatimonadaceae bacterium]